MKVVGLVLSFPTHVHTSHLDQRSPSYGRFGETDKPAKFCRKILPISPARKLARLREISSLPARKLARLRENCQSTGLTLTLVDFLTFC
ncbi:hypothetical protein QL285_007725 [Trifolium repens]|nr:hypothetical protein QL285_007725 [Trifolium repens]